MFSGVCKSSSRLSPCQMPKREHNAHNDAGTADGANGCFQHGIMFAAEQLGYNDSTADAAADGNSHENHGDGIGCPYSCQRLLPDEPPCDDAVGNVVKLLENHTDEHGNGKCLEQTTGIACSQVCIHEKNSFLMN